MTWLTPVSTSFRYIIGRSRGGRSVPRLDVTATLLALCLSAVSAACVQSSTGSTAPVGTPTPRLTSQDVLGNATIVTGRPDLAQTAVAAAAAATPTGVPAVKAATGAAPPAKAAATPARDDVKVVAQGFGGQPSKPIDDRFVRYGYGFLIDNPRPDELATDVRYQVTLYDASNAVVRTTSGVIPLLWPNARTGVAGTFDREKEVVPTRLEVRLDVKDFSRINTVPTWTTSNTRYLEDPEIPKVTAVIASAFPRDANDIRVSAILYDAAGTIIGGGSTYLDFVPSQGQAAVEIPVTSAEPPAKVEVYPSFSTLSVLGR